MSTRDDTSRAFSFGHGMFDLFSEAGGRRGDAGRGRGRGGGVGGTYVDMLFVLWVKGSVLFLALVRSDTTSSPLQRSTSTVERRASMSGGRRAQTKNICEEGHSSAICHPSIGEYRHTVRVDDVPATPLLDRSWNWWWRTMMATVRGDRTCAPPSIGRHSPRGGRGTRGPQHRHGMNGWA